MKRIIIFLIAIVVSVAAFSQQMQDVVTMKNGSVFKGLIVEQKLGEYLRIKTIDGNLITIDLANVASMKKIKQEVYLSEYGGQYSFGVCIGGGGVVGFPARLKITDKFALDCNVNLRPVFFN